MGYEVDVSAVVYNLAGDAAGRAGYLKSLVVRQTFSPASPNMGEAVTNGLLHGPGMRLRYLYNWMSNTTNYGAIGVPTGVVRYTGSVDESVLRSTITALYGYTTGVGLEPVEISGPTPLYWADRWVRANQDYPEDTGWVCSINEAGTYITIILSFGEGTHVIPVSSPDYDPAAWYIYIPFTHTIVYSGDITETSYHGLLYKYGTGRPELDAMISAGVSGGDYFPAIPVRVNNQFLSTTYQPTAYTQASRAYRKATGGARFDDLVAKLADNANLSDIDHGYVVFAVPLNVVDPNAKKYLYQFFDDLRFKQRNGVDAYTIWQAGGSIERDAYTNSLVIRGSSAYATKINWKFILEVNGTGLGKTGAQVGEIWFQTNGTVSIGERIRLYWQKTATEYTYLAIIGLIHYNEVAIGWNVQTKSFAALADTDESSFLVPLEMTIWRDMGLIPMSEMATACTFLVLNCFATRKTYWYESAVFRIVLVVVIAVASVLFTGGAGLGLLGAHLALGTALGFSGMTAAIIGAVVNALAAMILISLLEPLLAPLGAAAPVVMAILMFAIGQAAASFQNVGTLAINWGDLLKVDNLLNMTNALGQGVSNQVNSETLALQQQTLDYVEKAEQESKKIQQAYFDKFGYGAGIIDPLMLVDAGNGPIAESSSTFLARTLMTGSEIAEMSRELLYEFPTYSLKLPDAFT